MVIKRSTKKTKSVKPLHVEGIVQHAFTSSRNPALLFDQAKTFVFLLFSVLVFTGAMLVVGAVLFLAAFATNLVLLMFLAVFVTVLIWFVGLNIAAVFFNGMRFHLTMQHATHKKLDFHLAWKLSAARWHDAFWTQIVLNGFIFAAIALVLLLAVLVGSLNLVAGISTVVIGILILIALAIYVQPYLFLIFPIVFFEALTPRRVFVRSVEYVRPYFWPVFGLVVVFGVISWLISSVVSHASIWLVTYASAAVPWLAIIGMVFFILVNMGLVIFLSTFGTAIQTQLYLRIGDPKQQNVFVSRDPLAKHLSRMARHEPHHSPYFPVKWKAPGKKKR